MKITWFFGPTGSTGAVAKLSRPRKHLASCCCTCWCSCLDSAAGSTVTGGGAKKDRQLLVKNHLHIPKQNPRTILLQGILLNITMLSPGEHNASSGSASGPPTCSDSPQSQWSFSKSTRRRMSFWTSFKFVENRDLLKFSVSLFLLANDDAGVCSINGWLNLIIDLLTTHHSN